MTSTTCIIICLTTWYSCACRKWRCDSARMATERGPWKNVCLVDALRSLGVPLQYHCDGPFKVREHGNAWLAPLGCFGVQIEQSKHMISSSARYIKGQDVKRGARMKRLQVMPCACATSTATAGQVCFAQKQPL